MSSATSAGPRQVSNNGGYFINVASLIDKVYSVSGNNGTVAVALWASTGGGYSVGISTSLANAGRAVLRDMGKTLISSNRTFRKVQYVISTNSTFGVGGLAGTTPVVDYLTGYVELGLEGAGVPAPVAHFGR